jgi:hypothetical protein
MATAAIFESKVHAIKWALSPNLVKFGTQTKTDILSLKLRKAEVNGYFFKMAANAFSENR